MQGAPLRRSPPCKFSARRAIMEQRHKKALREASILILKAIVEAVITVIITRLFALIIG
jgi:hypothetical protein